MELKVWVEGIQRIVCGVTVNTTCQDVVFALAHATGQVGRFTLIERWRNNERLLAPYENPLKLLLKWGEYANDVQFILQRSEQKQMQQSQQPQPQQQQEQQQHMLQKQQHLQKSIISQNNSSNNTNNSSHNTNNSHNNSSNNTNNSHNNSSNNNSVGNSDTTNVVHTRKPLSDNNNFNNNNNNNTEQQYLSQYKQTQYGPLNATTKDLRNSFGATTNNDATKHIENIGIVKGVPQRAAVNISPEIMPYRFSSSPVQQQPQQRDSPASMVIYSNSNNEHNDTNNNNSNNNNNNNNINSNNNNKTNNYNDNIYAQIGPKTKSLNRNHLIELKTTQEQRIVESTEVMFITPNNNNSSNNINSTSTASIENPLNIFNANYSSGSSTSLEQQQQQQLYTNNNLTPTISANGALVPPPYRDPPPPRITPPHQPPYQSSGAANSEDIVDIASPATSCQTCNGVVLLHDIEAHGGGVCSNPFINDYNDFDLELQSGGESGGGGVGVHVDMSSDESESIFQATQYNDLLALIKFQREKINLQQTELNKYDAEIVYLENKERDQAQELDAISREITKADQIFRQGSEQLQSLQYVEEENELVKQQEKTLKSEIALLRSKLANCETELLQCKNKIRILMDDIEVEQRAITNKQKSNRQNVERDFLIEMERIQSEIDQAIHNTDTSNKTTENLKKEIQSIENAIAEKKRQVEKLVNEMKEVNLQSLTVTTSEEIKHLLEGSNKPGSSRRIIGSPRQLENAVPTSKNPHGVWV